MSRSACAFVACALIAQIASALTYPLSPEQVREAYSLGRDPEKRQAFFSKYIHFPAQPERGPDIHLIEFRTPYEQVALRSQEHWANYDGLDAEKDYAAQPDQVVVRVFVCATQTFSFPEPPTDAATAKDHLRGFQFHVAQDAPINPEKLTVRNALLGCSGAASDAGGFEAFEAFLYFNAGQFRPGSTKISVTRPDGQSASTEFDLDGLE
jgi:hypothetical protein